MTEISILLDKKKKKKKRKSRISVPDNSTLLTVQILFCAVGCSSAF